MDCSQIYFQFCANANKKFQDVRFHNKKGQKIKYSHVIYADMDLVFPSCSDFGSRCFYPKGELHNDQSIYACKYLIKQRASYDFKRSELNFLNKIAQLINC